MPFWNDDMLNNWSKKYSRDLHQGGLEVPCQYQFYSDNEECLKKVKELLEKTSYSKEEVIIGLKPFQKAVITSSSPSSSSKDNLDMFVVIADKTKCTIDETEDDTESPAKRMNIDTSRNLKKKWLRVGGIKLTMNNRDSMIDLMIWLSVLHKSC